MNWNSFRSDFNVDWKNVKTNIQNSTINSSFVVLSKWHDPYISHHDDYLYIPICQDPTPLTEDMLAEQAEIMLQLGMDAEGAQLRAKMQSASLTSGLFS